MREHVDKDTQGNQEADGDEGDSPELVFIEIIHKGIRSQVKFLCARYIGYIISCGQGLGDYSV